MSFEESIEIKRIRLFQLLKEGIAESIILLQGAEEIIDEKMGSDELPDILHHVAEVNITTSTMMEFLCSATETDILYVAARYRDSSRFRAVLKKLVNGG